MAINSIAIPCEKICIKSNGSLNDYKHTNLPCSRSVKIDLSTDGSVCSLTFKHGKFKKKTEIKSPYLKGESVQMLSRVTEKRYIHKKRPNIISSFPLDTNRNKANSDKFEVTKKNKKVKKSVLTLPNEPAALPESCTVSDMNDSEYFKRKENRKITKQQNTADNKRKYRARGKNFEFYDRDAQYCSQLNLDCSSAETVKFLSGDGKRISKSIVARSNETPADSNNPHDVWAVLRNINRFQLVTSPPMSEDSFVAPKKIKCPRRRNIRKDMRVFESCCTEEIAYISNYELDKSSRCNLSHSSSIDKITVIDKQHDFNTLSTKFGDSTMKKKEKVRPKVMKKKSPKNKSLPLKPKSNSNKYQKNQCDSTCHDCSFICGNYRELRKIIESNTRVDQDREIKITTNEGDDLVIDTPYMRENSQCSDFFYSENSGSSKAAASYMHITNTKDENKSAIYQNGQNLEDNVHYDLDKSDEQISGITRVVLNKAQNIIQPKIAEPLKINSFDTTSPSTNRLYTPKLTKTVLNRQINKYKFPIIILSKNQLSSTIKVINEEHPQFNGLDKQIWPFMLNWYGYEHTDSILGTRTRSFDCYISNTPKKKSDHSEIGKKIISKNNNEPKQSKFLDTKSKKDYKPTAVPLSEYLRQPLDQTKSKPVRQLRDRTMKLLCKNSSGLNINDRFLNANTKGKVEKTIKVDSLTDVIDKLSTKEVIATVDTKKSKTFSPIEKRPWAKAKCVSDFVDNVIRRIKSGVYYTHDSVYNRKAAKDTEQTVVTCEVPIDECISCVETSISYADDAINHDRESINSITIPGFDETPPALEIKTMNMNEISVKHCVTNIMVYFDVTDPTVPTISVNNSCDLKLIDKTKNETKIFKCQTSILNSMLPSELCSIVPKMMHKIAKLEKQLTFAPVLLDKTPSDLSTISEVPRYESPINSICPLKAVLHKPMAKDLWGLLLNGRYFKSNQILSKSHNPLRTSLLVQDELRLIKELSHKIVTARLFGQNKITIMPIMVNVQEKMRTPSVTSNQQIEMSTALQPYPVAEGRIRKNIFNIVIFSESTTSFLNNIGVSCFKIVNTIDNNTVKYFFKIPDIITLTIDNFKINSFCNGFKDSPSPISKISVFTNPADKIINAPSNCIEKVNCSSFKRNTSLQKYVVSVNNKNLRRKGFAKLYRKCKGSSYISSEKVTLLNKVKNLDDFFHALGSGKHLSGVFDSQFEHKIMSSIEEMKNWTTEMNQRQALLVLLLVNKKNTSNLLRYRHVLLQGIALKRITKANELDMEIEVIERENLSGLSRFEGITYLPASVENQDNLFEELCWIAKTTASDYQRPFDESSEKLLKSLLEKRKKLNPSYLRVMARYVGLGLLKSSKK